MMDITWKELVIAIIISAVVLFVIGCATQGGTPLKTKVIGIQLGMNRPVMRDAAVVQICNQGHEHVSLFKSDYDAIMQYIKWLEER